MVLWPDTSLFVVTFCGAALAGVANLLRSPDQITLRNLLAAVLFNGVAGTGFGMIAFEFLGGKQNPWRVIGCGMLVGIRIIKLSDVMTIVRKLIGTNGNDSDYRNKD